MVAKPVPPFLFDDHPISISNISSGFCFMPLYEFRCEDCGMFDVWRTMAESSAPAHCPECEKPGRRVFSPPMLLSSSIRLKKENREPQLVKRDQEPEKPKAKSHEGGRPWMISH